MADAEKPKGKSSKRVATNYIALMEQTVQVIGDPPDAAEEMVVLIRIPGTFNAFRREEVLDELVASKKITPDEETGKTPYVQITPARAFQRLRGTVEVTRRVVADKG